MEQVKYYLNNSKKRQTPIRCFQYTTQTNFWNSDAASYFIAFNPCPKTLAILNQWEDDLNHEHGPNGHDHETKNEGPRQGLQTLTLRLRAHGRFDGDKLQRY